MEALGPLLLPILAIVLLVVMFFSQRRRQGAIASLQASLKVGDDVVTTSGLFGRITALDELTVTLEVSPGTQLRYDRRAVATHVDPSGRPTAAETTPTAQDADQPSSAGEQ